MRIKLDGKYRRMEKKLLSHYPELQIPIRRSVKLFEKNPQDTRLGTHALTKKMTGKYAFSVTDDIRIIFEWIGPQDVRFLAIGSHPHVYPGYRKTVSSKLNDA